MRLWSVHPVHLDAKGLVALWREGLLAQKVLLGETRGYRHHPQLARFRACGDPVLAIGAYLGIVEEEARRRGYRFDRSKIVRAGTCAPIDVTLGQVGFEWAHLQHKLRTRAPGQFAAQQAIERCAVHPLFLVVAGDVEPWERAQA